MVVGTTTTTYDTTDPKTFNVDVYQGGENISIIENTGYTNHQTVSLVIGADIATNGNDIDLANGNDPDASGKQSGSIINVKNISMDTSSSENYIGSNGNRVDQIWGEFVYTRNIYSETHSQGTLAYPNNKPPVSGTAFSGGIRLQNLPTVEPVGTGTSTNGVLWVDSSGFLRVACLAGS